MGLDIRYVVTSLEAPSPEDIYARLYCACGHAANLTKLDKVRKTVCPLSRGGSPYTAPSRVARSGRADPHRRRTSRGAL